MREGGDFTVDRAVQYNGKWFRTNMPIYQPCRETRPPGAALDTQPIINTILGTVG
jgi:hypothetical protein